MTKKFVCNATRSAVLLAVTIIVPLAGFSQYYYKDLLTTQEVNRTYLLYKNNKISSVKLTSFQGNRPVTEGFICERKVGKNQVVTYTKTADAGEAFFTAFYNQKGLIIKTVDSSEETIATTIYAYDAADRVLQISNETHARDQSSKTAEVHAWLYNSEGRPVKMYRIKNNADTAVFAFTLDEKGNVSEEYGSKALPSKVYYYYNDQNRLTDIVRYNSRAGRLLPDYIFEYDENGELATMLLVPEGTSDYQKWYYKYDDMGLKAVEFCYNKKKELQGRIEYNYGQ